MANPVDERVKAISDHNQNCRHHYHFTIVNILYTDCYKTHFCLNFKEAERDYVRFGSLLSQIRLSVVCLSICNVCAPYSRGWSFWQYFFAVWYLSHCLIFVQNFMAIVPGKLLHRGVKRKRGSKIERFWTCRRLYLINDTRYGLGYNGWLIGNDIRNSLV